MLASKDYSSWRTIWTAETKHRAAGLPRRVSSAAASPRIVPVAAAKASIDRRVHPCLVLPLLRPSREERKPTSSKGAAGRKGRRRRAKERRALMSWTNGWRWIKKRGELHCSIMLQTKKAPLPQSGKKERPPQRQIEKRYLEQQNPTSTRNSESSGNNNGGGGGGRSQDRASIVAEDNDGRRVRIDHDSQNSQLGHEV